MIRTWIPGRTLLSFCLVPLLVLAAAASAGVDQEGGDPAARRLEAFEFFENGRFRRALPLLEEALFRKPDDVRVIQAIGYIRYKAEDFAAARAFFEASLEGDGDSHYALSMLGNIALQEFRLGDSLRYYRTLSSLNPEYPHLEGNLELLEERIDRVRTLKGLRERCDLFYYASLAGGVILLLLLAFLEFRTFMPLR